MILLQERNKSKTSHFNQGFLLNPAQKCAINSDDSYHTQRTLWYMRASNGVISLHILRRLIISFDVRRLKNLSSEPIAVMKTLISMRNPKRDKVLSSKHMLEGLISIGLFQIFSQVYWRQFIQHYSMTDWRQIR